MKKFLFFVLFALSVSSVFSLDVQKGKDLKSKTEVFLSDDGNISMDKWIQKFTKEKGYENIIQITINTHLMGLIVTIIYQE